MKNNHLISSGINDFYSKVSDEDRFTKGLGPLELERIQSLIQQYIRSPKSVIVDVGGGTGTYAAWLAGLGHQVQLVDPVQKHIRKARSSAAKLKQKFACHLGEAKELPFRDNYAEMVILHGPLYHLQSNRERHQAIKEAKRITKKNGIILGVAINYASFTLAGLLNGMIHQYDFLEMCKKHLRSGLHHPPENNHQLFLPEAFFHKPCELVNEFEEAGLKEIELMAVEGMIWLDQHFYETRDNPVRKKALMNLLRMTEKDKSLMSLSPHMMIVGRK